MEILDGIGSTEVLHIYLSNFPNRVRPGSLGVPAPGYEVKILDEDGKPVKENEVGTLWVKGESTTPYFWNGTCQENCVSFRNLELNICGSSLERSSFALR